MAGVATQLKLPNVKAGPMAPPLPLMSAREDWSEIESLLSSNEAPSNAASRSARRYGKVLILSAAVVLVAGGFAGGFATSPPMQNLCWMACGPSPTIPTVAAEPGPIAIPSGRTIATREATPDVAEGRSVAEPSAPPVLTPVATPPAADAVAEVDTPAGAPDAVDMTAPPAHRRHHHHRYHYGWR